MTSPYLPIAVRGYPVRSNSEPGKPSRRRQVQARWPKRVLIFDTETTTDRSQRLLFGAYQFCEWSEDERTLICREEGLFHADELQEFDPEGFAQLSEYAQAHESDTASDCPNAIKFISRSEFVERLIHKLGYKARAMIVGFNLPFDLSRIALDCRPARDRFLGGFSLKMAEYTDKKTGERREHPFRRRIRIKHVNSKMAFIEFDQPSELETWDQRSTKGNPRKPEQPFVGHFLDLRTLTFSLTDIGHSLASACDAFGVEHPKTETETHGVITPEYIDYNRRDVLASKELLEKLREEFDRHPISLDPCKAYSPASVAKAVFNAMKLKKPAEKFSSLPLEILGYAMSAFLGGRAEVRIRKTIMPIVYTDFLSMYPTVQTLMQIEQLLNASSLDMVDATAEVQDFLDRVTADDLLRPQTWPKLTAFALIIPDGDILPTRAKYNGKEYSLGVNPLTCAEPLCYALADLVMSRILTGKAPRITKAFRLVPKGRQRNLKPILMGGAVEVDPRTQNLFKTAIEERYRTRNDKCLPPSERERIQRFLKVFANAGSYGVFVEMIRTPLPKGESEIVSIYGREGAFESKVQAIEQPGSFCFPPIGVLITAAARLMLGLLERAVTDHGGAYVFADTDSMAIVASESGGLIPCEGGPYKLPDGRSAVRALSWETVDSIAKRFRSLNPYNRDYIPESILKIEDVNFDSTTGKQRQIHALAISAKRYAQFTIDSEGRPEIIDDGYSEHGLGQLLNPTNPESINRDWIPSTWQRIVEEHLGIESAEPEWLDQPAIMRAPVSTPVLLNRFDHINRGRPYPERVKAFNFLMSATVRSDRWPPGAVKEGGFHPVAPYLSNSDEWMDAEWTDLHSGRVYSLKAEGLTTPVAVRVQTFRDVLDHFRYHEEPKSADAAGNPSGKQTIGLLSRLHVRGEAIRHIGKESNLLEEQQHGVIHCDPQTVFSTGGDLEALRVWLGRESVAEVARISGISERMIRAIRNGERNPSGENLAAIEWALSRISSDP